MNENKEIIGIILAAGLSTRMGRLKQLLPIAGRPVVCRVAEAMRSRFERVLVILGHRAVEVAAALGESGVECVVNNRYQDGMLSSVQCALQAMGEERDFALSLGDQPSLQAETIDAVVDAWVQTDKGIILPTYCEKRGHPVLIRRKYIANILALGEGVGLNEVTRGFPEDTLEIALNSPEILDDMDTPADYEREVKRVLKGSGLK
jgi:molybdenum cofactor cytidylyltransferase